MERQVERQRPRLVLLTRAHRNSLSLSLSCSHFHLPTSPLTSRRVPQARLNYKPDNDGLFWMGLQDFVTHFNRLYVCRYVSAPQQRERR